MENFKTGVAYKRLTYKTCANSNLNADQSNFLTNKTVRLLLGLNVKILFKTKLENCLLLLACHYKELESAEILNAKTSTVFLKEVNISKTKSFC